QVRHPESVAGDVRDREDERVLDLRLGEGAADHLEALACGERVLPGVRRLGATDPDQEGGGRAVGPDLADDLEVTPMERLEAADEKGSHRFLAITRGSNPPRRPKTRRCAGTGRSGSAGSASSGGRSRRWSGRR